MSKIPITSVLVGITLLSFISCSSTSDHALPTSPDELVIEVQGQESLSELVVICQGVTGTNFTYDADVARDLEGDRVPFSGTVRVTPGEFDKWFERTLAEAGYRCRRIGEAELKVMQIMR